MKKQWIILMTVVITALIVGGAMYFVMQSKITKDNDALQAQIDNLNTKLSNTNDDLGQINTNQNTNSVTTITNTNATTVVDWKTYNNTTYDFSLTFPNDAWKNYKVIEYTPSDNTALKYLYIAVPTTDTSWQEIRGQAGYASPIAISIYTKAQWAAAQSDTMLEKSVGQNDKYVFTISGWQDSPTDLANVDFATAALKNSFVAN
ncbi:MAG: hypothetical protein WCO23_03355 [bacterium]